MHSLISWTGGLLFTTLVLAVKSQDCEVCINTIEKFKARLDEETYGDQKLIKSEFEQFCQDVPKTSKENRFCYYLGGLPESATSTLAEFSRQISMRKDADKICKELKKKDRQLCELRYKKQVDWKNVNLKKLKVKDLKDILSDWNEICDGCIEKSDFISRIEQLKSKHVKDEL